MTYTHDLPMPQDIEFCTNYAPGEAPVCTTCTWEEEDHPEYGDLSLLTDTHGMVLRMYASVNGGVVVLAYEHPERYRFVETMHMSRRRVAAASAETPREAVAEVMEQIMVGT